MLVREKIDYNKKIVALLIKASVITVIGNAFFLLTEGLGELAFSALYKYIIFVGLLIGGGAYLGYLVTIFMCLGVMLVYQIVKFIKLLVKKQPLSNMIPNRDSWIILRDFTLLWGDTEYYNRCK